MNSPLKMFLQRLKRGGILGSDYCNTRRVFRVHLETDNNNYCQSITNYRYEVELYHDSEHIEIYDHHFDNASDTMGRPYGFITIEEPYKQEVLLELKKAMIKYELRDGNKL